QRVGGPLPDPTDAARPRRIQLSAGRRHLRRRPHYESHASLLDSLREHTHYPAADVYVEVPARPGVGAGGRPDHRGTSAARDLVSLGAGLGRRNLDATGLGTARLGFIERIRDRDVLRHYGILGAKLLGWYGAGDGRCAALWRRKADGAGTARRHGTD